MGKRERVYISVSFETSRILVVGKDVEFVFCVAWCNIFPILGGGESTARADTNHIVWLSVHGQDAHTLIAKRQQLRSVMRCCFSLFNLPAAQASIRGTLPFNPASQPSVCRSEVLIFFDRQRVVQEYT
jgi:hypothetical protein